MKQRFRRLAASLSLLTAYLFSMPMTVFATDTGNAVSDILNDRRFNGAMSSIQSITEFIDTWFIRIITVTAFFIISVSLLQNVMAAAYVAFPKFWNRVHEAHQKKALMGALKGVMGKFGKGGQPSGNNGGDMTDVLFGLIPDIKALTAFADADIPPKQYFTKAIPQMCFMVIIGVFIYNGYYRDVSAKVGDAGASIIEGLLSSTDPNTLTDYVFGYEAEPDGAYEADNSYQGQWIKDISQEMYRALKSNAEVWGKSTENKEFLLRSAEYWAYQFVTAESGSASDGATGATPGVTWEGNNPGPLFVKTDAYVYKLTGLNVTLLKTTGGGAAPSVKTQDTTNQSYAFRITLPVSAVVEGADADPGLQGKVFSITASMVPEPGSYGENFETQLKAAASSISGAGSIPVTGLVEVTIPEGAYDNQGNYDLATVIIGDDLAAAIIKELPTTDEAGNQYSYSINGMQINGVSGGIINQQGSDSKVKYSDLVGNSKKVTIPYTITRDGGNTATSSGNITVKFVGKYTK